MNEIADALSLIKEFSHDTLFIYDRLFFCQKILKSHELHGSFFVARLKRNAHKSVMSFFTSKRRFKAVTIHGVTIYLIKVKTPKGTSVYATNLAKEHFTIEDIAHIYKLRWQVETAFFELTTSGAIESWHSTTYNGVLQELYTRLWLYNATRLLIGSCQTFASVGMTTYYRANFKVIMHYVAGDLHRYWRNFFRLFARVKALVATTSQRREVYRRNNPRVLKSPRSPYKYCSTEWQWDKKWSLTS